MFDFSATRALIIAHRGARCCAPENTLEAASLARTLHADLWELDVNRTKDARLVVIHDDTLTRTTDVTAHPEFADREPWRVCDFTLEELRSLDAGSWFTDSDPYGRIASGEVTAAQCSAYRGVRIPTLQEALALTRDAGWAVNIEIKDLNGLPGHETVTAEVLDLVRRLGIRDSVVLSSFQHDYLEEARKLMPQLSTAALVEDIRPEDPVELCRALDVQAYHPSRTLLEPGDVQALREAGIAVNVWTVNDMNEAERLIRQGVKGIITDFPNDCLAMMRRQGLR